MGGQVIPAFLRIWRVSGPRTAVYFAFGARRRLVSVPNDPVPHNVDLLDARPTIDPIATNCGSSTLANSVGLDVIFSISHGDRRSPKLGASVHQNTGMDSQSRNFSFTT